MSLVVTSQGNFILRVGRVPVWAFRQTMWTPLPDLMAFVDLEVCSVLDTRLMPAILSSARRFEVGCR